MQNTNTNDMPAAAGDRGRELRQKLEERRAAGIPVIAHNGFKREGDGQTPDKTETTEVTTDFRDPPSDSAVKLIGDIGDIGDIGIRMTL